MQFEPAGVIPACILPFQADLSIDESAFERHLRHLAGVEGISAITVNGHSCEVHALNFEEQRRTLEIAVQCLGAAVPVVAGIFANSSVEAGRLARMSTDCGARGLLVFPPEMTWLGFREEMVVEHFRHVTDNTDLPLILFQYPSRTAFCYPLSLITKLCGLYPQIRAVKDMVGDPVLHEQQIRELHALPRPVRVLTTHSAWLLGSLALGCDGLLSGAGSVIADLHVALFQAVKQDNLGLARRINDRIYPLTRAFYDPPLVDMHNRMKEALVLLGRLPRATVRPPLHKLTDAEVARIRRQLVLGGMLAD